MSRVNDIYTDYMNDIERYLKSRFPKVIPEYMIQETAAYISNRTIVLVNDVQRAMWCADKNELLRRQKRMNDLRKEMFKDVKCEEV